MNFIKISALCVVGALTAVSCAFGDAPQFHREDLKLFSDLSGSEFDAIVELLGQRVEEEQAAKRRSDIDSDDVRGDCGFFAHLPGLCGGSCLQIRLDGLHQLLLPADWKTCIVKRGRCARTGVILPTCGCDTLGGEDVGEPFPCRDGPPPNLIE